jgi:hypothetical protein
MPWLGGVAIGAQGWRTRKSYRFMAKPEPSDDSLSTKTIIKRRNDTPVPRAINESALIAASLQ